MMKRNALMAIAGMSFWAWPAAGQDVVDAGTIVLDSWSYDAIYNSDSWSVDDFFGADVAGRDGTQIGNVEDLVLNDEGDVVALIAEVGGFWDIGDTHVSVPWEMVQFGVDGSVTTPVTEENTAEFDLFSSSPLPDDADLAEEIVEGVDDEELVGQLWRASDLIGDYVRIKDEDELWLNFGYVSDLLINDGSISAALVSTTGRYAPGTYAYPYSGYSAEGYGLWRPNATTQDVPMLVGDAMSMPVFEMDQMQSN